MASKVVESQTVFSPKEKIWRGPKRDIERGIGVSLGALMLETLVKNPKHISQICDSTGRQYSNEEIAVMSIRVAQFLREMGLQQEDIIGICAANTDFLAPLVLGALLSGIVLSTLDPSFDKDGVKHIFAITRPKAMFCDGKVYATVKSALTEIGLDIPICTMKDHLEGVGKIEDLIAQTGREKHFNVEPLKFGASQTAAILCSSGTTGTPKGVCMSHESLLNGNCFHLSVDDKLLCFSTLYWGSGLLVLVHGTLSGATRVITDEQFTPELFLRIVEQYKVTCVASPPSQLAVAVQSQDIGKRDLSSLELYIVGGSAVPFAVIQNFSDCVKGCHLVVAYGMSEVSSPCSIGKPTKPGASGYLMSNYELKIIDDSGRMMGINEKGEVCIRTPFKWAGYYKNQQATDALYDQENWIHSGDIGYFDEEGSLFIVDRKKDILKFNNFHFSPTEIEEVLMEIPDIVEACVCGIPDIISSFLPAAAIVKLPTSKLTEDYVSRYIAERMAHFKHLRGGVYFLDALPKTVSGKNVRSKATAIVEALRNKMKADGEVVEYV